MYHRQTYRQTVLYIHVGVSTLSLSQVRCAVEGIVETLQDSLRLAVSRSIHLPYTPICAVVDDQSLGYPRPMLVLAPDGNVFTMNELSQ